MNRTLTTIIAIALSIAAGASYLVYRLTRTSFIANAAPSSSRIVVATRNLETGTLVRDSDLRLATWAGATPKGSAKTPKDFIGRGVISPIYEGEAVTDSRLAATGAGGGLAATIPDGMR